MADVLERNTGEMPAFAPEVAPDERPARRTLLDQVERLEGELSSLVVATWPRKNFEFAVPARSGPARMLTFGELERVRDELADRVERVRQGFNVRTRTEEQYRRLIEEMMLAPSEYKWVRVSNEEIGEPGCKHWHVTPRWGLFGMLMDWWRVKISSGCPLAEGCGPGRSPI